VHGEAASGTLASVRRAGWFDDDAANHTAKTPRAGRRVGVEGEGGRRAVPVLGGIERGGAVGEGG
jgi:hypothetical protein